jgi:hypothetical protein
MTSGGRTSNRAINLSLAGDEESYISDTIRMRGAAAAGGRDDGRPPIHFHLAEQRVDGDAGGSDRRGQGVPGISSSAVAEDEGYDH